MTAVSRTGVAGVRPEPDDAAKYPPPNPINTKINVAIHDWYCMAEILSHPSRLARPAGAPFADVILRMEYGRLILSPIVSMTNVLSDPP